jgi:peptide/nickel transport system permease protein
MTQYIIRRLLLQIPVLIGVSILVFALARILPGDVFAAQSATSGIDKATQDQLRKEAGLDRPLVVQYLDWAGDALRGDFGESLYNRQDVSPQIRQAAPVTIELTILATFIGLLIAIPAGVVSAITRGSPTDYLARFGAVLGLSIPSYVLGTLAITYFSLWFGWIPPSGYISIFDDPSKNAQQFIIPAIILGSAFAASIMRMTRSTVLGVLREDYVRTARAKGLQERAVIIQHVLRTALLPVMTLVGTQVGSFGWLGHCRDHLFAQRPRFRRIPRSSKPRLHHDPGGDAGRRRGLHHAQSAHRPIVRMARPEDPAVVTAHPSSVAIQFEELLPAPPSRWREAGRLARENPAGAVAMAVLLVLIAGAVLADWIAPFAKTELATGTALDGPNATNFFGTDRLGRDIFSRMLYGARISLYVGFGSVILGTLIGSLTGLISGFAGGWLDLTVQRLLDIMMSIPPCFSRWSSWRHLVLAPRMRCSRSP